MNPRFYYLPVIAALLGIAFLSTSLSLSAQEVPSAPADGQANASVLEQEIYIPYEKLRLVFEKHGRGVFLPYEKFQELWKAARQKTAKPDELKPPLGALITEIENEATVEKDIVRVKALLKIEILNEGWNEIPLRLADAAIINATLDGKPARIIGGPNKQYKLLVEKKGKKPEQIELKLEYAKAIDRKPGQNSVSFQTPRSPVSRWRMTIPQSGVKVNIHPMIAATEVPADEKPNETVVLAFVGAAAVVRIDWNPKAEGATGLEALASVQAQQQAWINQGVTRTRTQLVYTIARAELTQLVVEVPADQKVVNVFDANVRQWSVEASGDLQKITAQLFEPAKDTQHLTVELEKFTGEKDRRTVKVPLVKAVGVGRQQGVVVVNVVEGLRAETTKHSGLLQIDANELPGALRGSNCALAFRYAVVPFELTLAVEKIQPRILVDSLVEAYLEPEKISVDLSAVYDVQRAGVFRLELNVPADYEVCQVRGRKMAGANAVQVDGHYLDGEKKNRLVVNLSKKAIGRVGLLVELQKELDEPDLLAPTGKAATIEPAVPYVIGELVERATGRLVVYAPESLRINPTKIKDLRAVTFNEALAGMQSTRGGKTADVRPVLAFAYAKAPVALALSAERRKPQITIKQLLIASIEDGVLKYRAHFHYNILYSGVKSLRIDVPADVAATLRNNTPGVREKIIDPQPKDIADGYVAWSLAGETELLGSGKIELSWEKKIEKLGVGKSVDLPVPRLKPMNVDRAWGQIVLIKAETIDVHESDDLKGLRPIDPQHDLITPVAGAARAFEFHDDWTLVIVATRYQLEEVKRTGIECAVVRMVVTRADRIPVQALYRMRSVRQRLELTLPDGVTFDSSPLRINGRRVPLEQGRKGRYFVPLADSNSDKPFLLELRYTVPGNGSRLELPQFPMEPAVQKVFLCAYLPDEWTLLGATGPWTKESSWSDDEQLVAQVCQGIDDLTGDPVEQFQTDGRLHVYSTMCPAAPPKGLLKLKTMHRTGLNALVFGLVVLGGLLLLRAGIAARAMAVGVLVVALVLSGTFMPTFSEQILSGVLASAVFIVLVIWTVWYFMRRRPRVSDNKGDKTDA